MNKRHRAVQTVADFLVSIAAHKGERFADYVKTCYHLQAFCIINRAIIEGVEAPEPALETLRDSCSNCASVVFMNMTELAGFTEQDFEEAMGWAQRMQDAVETAAHSPDEVE